MFELNVLTMSTTTIFAREKFFHVTWESIVIVTFVEFIKQLWNITLWDMGIAFFKTLPSRGWSKSHKALLNGVSGLSWCCKPHREQSTDLLMLLRFWVRLGCSPSGLSCSWSECTLESSSSGNSKNLLDQHKRYGSLPGAHNRWEHSLVGSRSLGWLFKQMQCVSFKYANMVISPWWKVWSVGTFSNSYHELV